MKKLILKNHQSPGDIVILTAAVRDFSSFRSCPSERDSARRAAWKFSHRSEVTRVPKFDFGTHCSPKGCLEISRWRSAATPPESGENRNAPRQGRGITPSHALDPSQPAFPLVPKFYFGTGLSAKLCFFLYGMEPLCTAMKRSFGDGSVPKCNFGTRNFGTRKSNCLRSY